MRLHPHNLRFTRAARSLGILAVLALVASTALTSCRAHRTLEIRTIPPGAEIVLDQEILGPSPVKIEFYHYGARRISASLPNYRTHSEQVEIVPPWYARFPIDLISEVFLPIGWRDRHVVEFELTAGLDEVQAPDILSVLERAEVMRRAGPDGVGELPAIRTTSVGASDDADDSVQP